MAVLPILQYPDPRLSQRAETVVDFDDTLKKHVEDLFETHYAQQNCAALAATQLGIMLRITVIDFSEEKNQPFCLINPEFTHVSGTTNEPEGCMSLDGIFEKVKRSEVIDVTYQDINGQKHHERFDGFMAKCIQHELDHLDGKLLIDRVSSLKAKLISGKLRKLRKLFDA